MMYPLICQKCGTLHCRRHRLHMIWLRLKWLVS